MGQPQRTILLFDIDGTLLHADGAGRSAFEATIAERTGVADSLAGVDLRGMTDVAILAAGLTAAKLDAAQQLDGPMEARYIELLNQELNASTEVKILPGVLELLDALAIAGPHLAIGLGTGNLRQGAYAKLGRVGLSERFGFGGFGSDALARSELLAAGARRGAANWGLEPSQCRVVVIGDTALDIAAGLAIGAEVLAVGTSGVPVEELKSAGATWAYADLTDPGALVALVGVEAV